MLGADVGVVVEQQIVLCFDAGMLEGLKFAGFWRVKIAQINIV